MRQTVLTAAAIAVAATLASSASAGVSITATTSAAPTYSTVLNFDQPGEPTGTVPSNSWASFGISSLVGGADSAYVGQFNNQPGYGWLGNGNVAAAAWGLYITFSTPVTSFSCQYWDDSGPASFFGGGAAVIAYPTPYNGNNFQELFENNPAYGGIGASWINITTTGGTTISEIDFVGFGDFPTAYIDNLSWTPAPAPGTAGLLGLGGIAMIRRRRA